MVQCFSSKMDGSLVNTYKYWMINQLEKRKYFHIRQTVVKYCNYNRNVNRFVSHAVNELVLIHPMNKLYFMKELDNLAPTYGVPLHVNKQKQFFGSRSFPHTAATNLNFVITLPNWFGFVF